MKKDIVFPKVENVWVAVVQDEGWKVYLINRNDQKLDTVMVTSKGYGGVDKSEQKTSVLRHVMPVIAAGEYALIEPLDEQVLHLTNEYWVSFFINGQLFDKKYIFVPDTIISDNLSFIPELNKEGILHQ